jgi:hypothetical protein
MCNSDWASLGSQTTTSITTTKILPQNCKSENPNVPSLFWKITTYKIFENTQQYQWNKGGWDSSVSIATGYGLDGPRFFAHAQTSPGAHPSSCTMGTGSFRGVKQPRHGADHPPPSSAEVNKKYTKPPTPPPPPPPPKAFGSVMGYLYLTNETSMLLSNSV